MNAKPEAAGSRLVKVQAINGGAYATLQYERWVEQRRAIVEKVADEATLIFLDVPALVVALIANFFIARTERELK